MALIEIETKTVPTGEILYLFLNNPLTKNSMTWEMGELFEKNMKLLSQSKKPPRAIVISGRNEIFSAGGDLNLLKSFSKKSFSENRKGMRKFYNFFLSVRNVPIPIVCAANGHAIGAGLAITLACDLRVYANEGKYSFNFVKLGIHPGMGSSYTTQELIGKSRANRLLFLAETLSGKEAAEWGLCDYSVSKKDVLSKAEELAISLSEAAPMALRELKENTYSDDALQAALKKESEAQAKNFISDDFKETIRSIEEKRKPVFLGI
ncbi:enoyl-CoA hydratase/isomerase family protein [Leptospira sp. GIMC2001]|uniref:enoyl-CoA hydratase/isomerase family protein n=1 Tax=Leptospira sp. GIMC2001 TaxID=1513297 RepID=UPI00234AD232|nr:enoyl-CoA hydratase/isomerase family protein [Leptospira sp. GIMC2001]WCL48860.1 enoyl-CoA hydratase/isomerase family protein [Leptospira sp. GIMC2001]